MDKSAQTEFELLTDYQWGLIENIIDDKRKWKNNLRDVADAIFFIIKTGVQ